MSCPSSSSFGFQLFVLRRTIPNLKRVLIGFFMSCLGWPVSGRPRACAVPARASDGRAADRPGLLCSVPGVTRGIALERLLLGLHFRGAIGFSTTIAEPSLIAVAIKAKQVSAGAVTVWGLRIAVAIGVAIGIGLGTFRIVTGRRCTTTSWPAISSCIVQTIFAPRAIIALAYDSGGVTTSTVTVPLVAALGLGLASTVPGRSTLLDGFGLIAFASVFPIMTVLGYAQLAEWRERRQLLEPKEV